MSNISVLDFNTVKNMAQNLENSMLYDLNDFNCTNYGLEVFNSIRPNNPVVVPKTINVLMNIVDYGITPNGLYLTLKDMENSNNGIQIGSFYAPSGSGGCN